MPSTCCNSSNIFISPHHHNPTQVVPLTARSNRPESYGRFPTPVKSGGGVREVTVVDFKSCRQLYLRSAYTFSRAKESKDSIVKEKAKKCLARVKDRVALAKGLSSASLFSILRRILGCTSTAKASVINRG